MEESKKGNKKGLIIIILLLVVCLFFVIWFWINKSNTEKLEKLMEKPVLDYFEKYVSVNSGSSAYKVTLGMLKEANQEGEKYNLAKLTNCSNEKTYGIVSIDFATGKITDTKIKINCKN